MESKKKNIDKLLSKEKDIQKEKEEEKKEAYKFDEALVKGKNSFMTKGIQTMLRLTSDNHLELSGMADGKANILISVNAIIISVILSVSFPLSPSSFF